MGKARTATAIRPSLTGILMASGLVIGALATAIAAHAQDNIIESHGISAFGDLKYPADFTHFDYVNPDAPKGGEMIFRGTAASQTFDSLNPFILKGEPAQGLGLLYDSLLAGSGDEADSADVMPLEGREQTPRDRAALVGVAVGPPGDR